MESKLYGRQDVFAIEVNAFDAQKQKGKIRFWLNGKQFGDLKRIDKLTYSAKSLKIMLTKNEELYDSAFDDMSIQEIFSYCLFLDKKSEDFGPEDYVLFQKMKMFSLYFGDQLDNVAHIIFCKDGLYHFLWSYNNDYSGRKIDYHKNLDHTSIPIDEVKSVSLLYLKDLGLELTNGGNVSK
jgi:hypothetical protein